MENSLTVILKVVEVPFEGPRDAAVVRAITSHHCGLHSNPSVDAICGLSLLLVLSFVLRGISPGTPVFPSLQKPTFPNFNSTRSQVGLTKDHFVDVLPPNHYLLFIISLFLRSSSYSQTSIIWTLRRTLKVSILTRCPY